MATRRHNYRTIWGWGLKVDDEIRAADGTWGDPLTRVHVPPQSHLPVLVWERLSPPSTDQSNPDYKIFQHARLRVRRPA